MTLDEAQQRVDAWIRTYGVRYFSELTNMAVLTEEVGELARIMARKYGDQSYAATPPATCKTRNSHGSGIPGWEAIGKNNLWKDGKIWKLL